jgi:hypothetical protein
MPTKTRPTEPARRRHREGKGGGLQMDTVYLMEDVMRLTGKGEHTISWAANRGQLKSVLRGSRRYFVGRDVWEWILASEEE